MSHITISPITMPKACVSCQFFKHIGRCADKYSPHKPAWGEKISTTKYGKCNLHMTEVFITELCEQFKQEPHTEVYPVKNRPRPKEPRQAILIDIEVEL